MTQTVGRFGGPVEPAPQNIEQMIERVRGWHNEHGRWFVTKKGPDGTGFPPSWPLTYEETAELVLALAKDRELVAEWSQGQRQFVTVEGRPLNLRLTLIGRCVSCKHEADVTDATDVPACPKCFSPMVAVRATAE